MPRGHFLSELTRSLFLSVALVWSSSAHAESLSEKEQELFALAAHFAPVIVQGIGSHEKADLFTRVDFDGDFRSNNNWKNLKHYRAPAFVYYDVIESTTHYFITYGLFYPRDYHWFCFWKHCHENDFEGIRVTVEKDDKTPMGRLWMLETLAHNVLRFDRNPAEIGVDHPRPVVVVEKYGHGVYSWNQRRPDKNTTLFTYGSFAEDPRERSGEFYTYDLLPMKELWDLKHLDQKNELFTKHFDHRGDRYDIGRLPEFFAGKKWGKGARPAWSWSPKNRGLKQGDWFLDPAYSLCRMLHCDYTFSLNYEHHPYLGIEGAKSLTLSSGSSSALPKLFQ